MLNHSLSGRLALFVAVVLLGAGPTLQRASAGAEDLAEFGAGIVFSQLSVEGDPQVARLVRLLPDGSLRILSEDFHSARDPDVSFDGSRILFSGKRRATSHWQIYEMASDGSGARQVVDVPMDCRHPIYQSTIYAITSDEPWHQISFVGSADDQAPGLYSAKLDGTSVRRITHHPYGETDPFLMPDGRILFAGRQSNRLEPGDSDRVALFATNLDGTDYAIFAGDEGARLKRMPCVTAHRLVVFVESEEPTRDGSGHLGAVTLRRNLHSHRALTHVSDGLYHSPSPLPNGEILVSRRPRDGSGSHAVYRFDPDAGRVALIHDDPQRHDIQARSLSPRPEPDGRSSVVNPGDPTGVLYGLNVYTTDFERPDWLPPGSLKRLRVLEGLPLRKASVSGPPSLLRTRMLGEIDVERDGSFNIRVPANIPIRLQLLDADGLALRTCDWIWVRNRESRGCIGCHEDAELTPENRMVEAVTKPSVSLTPPPERRRTVDFSRDVAPIVFANCTDSDCHTAGGIRGAGRQALAPYLDRTARTSPLVWHLLGRDTSRPWDEAVLDESGEAIPPECSASLAEEEKRTIIEWIDLGAH
ncbi:MAG: HzsA-related protein [Planctomycetota bacterium]|jgi:Tol biopolymer transport system component